MFASENSTNPSIISVRPLSFWKMGGELLAIPISLLNTYHVITSRFPYFLQHNMARLLSLPFCFSNWWYWRCCCPWQHALSHHSTFNSKAFVANVWSPLTSLGAFRRHDDCPGSPEALEVSRSTGKGGFKTEPKIYLSHILHVWKIHSPTILHLLLKSSKCR